MPDRYTHLCNRSPHWCNTRHSAVMTSYLRYFVNINDLV
jgi:hypothetical protein